MFTFSKFTIAVLALVLSVSMFASARNLRKIEKPESNIPIDKPEPVLPILPIFGTKCTDASRKVKFCTAIHKPVCAYKPDMVCIKEPCNYVTYANACQACRDSDVVSYRDGECEKKFENQPTKPLELEIKDPFPPVEIPKIDVHQP